MERFATTRGKVKDVTANGGLAELAKKYFDNVESTGENAFTGSHGIMKSIEAHYKGDALIVEVDNEKPDFSNPESMKAAREDRLRWTQFLDESTGYDSKKRGDKAKEWGKKANKAKSSISAAKHFMTMAKNLPQETIDKANDLIQEIESALEEGDNTKAAGRGEKLSKLLNK